MPRNEVLVDTEWAQGQIDNPNVVFVEVDEDTAAYDNNHIKGAVGLNWRTELQDGQRRDIIGKEAIETLLSKKGIANEHTIVLYGGNNNWFASYAYWYLKLYGHQDVKLLDGGRKKWELEGRELVSEPTVRQKLSMSQPNRIVPCAPSGTMYLMRSARRT